MKSLRILELYLEERFGDSISYQPHNTNPKDPYSTFTMELYEFQGFGPQNDFLGFSYPPILYGGSEAVTMADKMD